MRELSIISLLLLFGSISAQNLTQTGKITPIVRQGSDFFGFDLKTKNNLLFSSSHGNYYDSNGQNNTFKAGAVYVFERQNNNWIQKNKLVPNDRNQSDEFGKRLTLGGDHLFIGAQGKKNGSKNNVGAVYLFDQDASGNWIQKQKIDPQVISNYVGFGNRLSATSNILVVGSEWSNAEVHEFDNTTQKFIYKQSLLSTNNANTYGNDVSVFGDKIFVGKSNENVNGVANAGQVNIYKKNSVTGLWEISQIINSPTPGETQFGFKVYAKDDYLFAMGSYFPSFVAVYKYNSSTDQYQHVHTIGNGATYFGSPISMENGLLAIGASGATNDLVTGGGAVFLYRLENGIWVQKQKIYNTDSHPYDSFGNGVSISNGIVSVGAPDHDFDASGNNIGTSTGAVYFFEVAANLGTSELVFQNSNKIYPNPFSSHISVQLEKQYDHVIADVYDMSGKKIFTDTYSGQKILDLPLEGLPLGYYQIHVYTKDKTLITSKVVKK